MSLVLVRPDGASMTFDATVSLTETRSVSLTEYPVEDGASISDAAVVLPPAFTLTGVVGYEGPISGRVDALSAGALGAAAGGVVGRQTVTLPPALTGRARLVAARAFIETCLGLPLTLIWRGRAWSDVFIQEITQDSGGTVYQPQISARQVRRVFAQTTRLPRRVRRSKPSLQQEQPTGVQPTPAATPAQAAQTDISLLATIADTKAVGDVLNRLGASFLTKRAP